MVGRIQMGRGNIRVMSSEKAPRPDIHLLLTASIALAGRLGPSLASSVSWFLCPWAIISWQPSGAESSASVSGCLCLPLSKMQDGMEGADRYRHGRFQPLPAGTREPLWCSHSVRVRDEGGGGVTQLDDLFPTTNLSTAESGDCSLALAFTPCTRWEKRRGEVQRWPMSATPCWDP